MIDRSFLDSVLNALTRLQNILNGNGHGAHFTPFASKPSSPEGDAIDLEVPARASRLHKSPV